MIRFLLSGGPGSGCTSTARLIGQLFHLPVFDSDIYFHKPTNPPFQEQYTPEERRENLGSALAAPPCWILSGSVATWEVSFPPPTHGVFLDLPAETRLARLEKRQREQFGSSLDPGGAMHAEHLSFMEWAAGYEARTDAGRNRKTDRAFLEQHCPRVLDLTLDESMDRITPRIIRFLDPQG